MVVEQVGVKGGETREVRDPSSKLVAGELSKRLESKMRGEIIIRETKCGRDQAGKDETFGLGKALNNLVTWLC